MLATQSKSRLVGANAPGIISAIGRCRIGFQPLQTFSPGHIGIVAKSGTLSYETVGSLTRAGLGQSLCIGMGGDVIAGTNHVDALKVFEHDEDTEAIIIVGELGGTSEEEAAEWIRDYRKRVRDPKPIAAVVGGYQAAPGKVMGHAGAWTGLGEGTAEEKYKALESAGVTMVDHPAKFGAVMKDVLAKSGRNVKKIVSTRAGKGNPRLAKGNLGTVRCSRTAAAIVSYNIPLLSKTKSRIFTAKALSTHQRRTIHQSSQILQHKHIPHPIDNPRIKPLPRHNRSSLRPLPLYNRRTYRPPLPTPPPGPPLPIRLPRRALSQSHH